MLPLPPPLHVQTYTVDGVARQALVYDGAGPAPKAGRPLVLAFHGHTGTMRSAARAFAAHEILPEASVVYPEGLPAKGIRDPEGKERGWLRDGEGERDLKLVDAILARAKGTDPKRVYAMGHSNGGNFVYILWARRGSKFAAYGPSGSPAGRLLPEMRPAPAFVTAGEADPLVPFAAQRRTMDAILRKNGADVTAAKTDGPVTLYPGKNGWETGTYIHPGGHEYPRAAAEATLAFLRRQSRP